jgi:hypothetical protein
MYKIVHIYATVYRHLPKHLRSLGYYTQIEGMGLLEYQAMPSLRDLAHDGWLCTFLILYNSRWKFQQLAAGQLLSGQPVRYGKGRRYVPPIMYKITPAGSLSSRQPGGPPCWSSTLAYDLIGCPYCIREYCKYSNIEPKNYS